MRTTTMEEMRNIDAGAKALLTGADALNACKGLYNPNYQYYAYCKKHKMGVGTKQWATWKGFCWMHGLCKV